jgi:hypothetical protein
MCVLMTDVPSRGVSAVLTDVQSWPRATRGLSSCGGGGNRGDRGGRSVGHASLTRPRGAVTPGRTAPYGTFHIFRSRPSTRARMHPCLSVPAPGGHAIRRKRRSVAAYKYAIWSHRHIRPRPASGPCGRARVATMTIGDAYVDDRGHL